MKTEIWNGYQIRFVEKDGEWWAVAKDITDALGFRDANVATRKMPDKYKGTHKVRITSDKAKSPETQEMIVLNEKGLYRLIMRSNKPEAEEFQDWVYEMLKQLRQSTGLEGFQVFRMLDKEHQKEAMAKLKQSLKNPVQVSFIKANTITNKAISTKYGYPKMIKKADMTPKMLVERQEVLDCTVELMGVKEKYGLDFSVSDEVNKVVTKQTQTA
ncbi:BRO-N domain-containing protein [Anaerosporobacter faecicola]|uniref:BRO-N domain-containing protein n=1 Tax=Anaerosporobacter faecicola TaxID=2718714 RepID=UPI0014391B3F|nr:BRO family protein [Anaerosporobacter faecicola]